jgi:hypothetical protein
MSNLVSRLLGAGKLSPLALTLRVTAGGVCWILGRLVGKLIWYRWLRATSDYSQIPWIWQDRCNDGVPTIYKFLPFVMQVSPSGGLCEYLELMKDPSSRTVRPIVYSGASIAFEPTVTISDSKYFSAILNDLEGFPKYSKFYYLLDPILGKGLVCVQGEEHKSRERLSRPCFTLLP